MNPTISAFSAYALRNQINYGIYINVKIVFCHQILEPVGSVSPKFNAGDELNIVRSKMTLVVTLLCPAQSYPTPIYR